MHKLNKKLKKKTYEPPQLRVIEVLEGPEVLGTGCKMAASGTNYGASPCIVNSCALLGS